jgi:L-fucose isomerase-like protein
MIKIKPKAFIIFTSMDGVDLDQDKLVSFQEKFREVIAKENLDLKYLDFTVSNEENAGKANFLILKAECELLIIVSAVWTSDTTVLRLIESLDLPIILFTTSLSPHTIGINGAQLIASTLKELDIRYKFIFGNIEDNNSIKKITDFSYACSLHKRLRKLRIGVVGYRPKIMTNLAADEFSVKKIFGSSIVPIDFSDMEKSLKDIKKSQIDSRISEIKATVGKVEVADFVLAESVSYYFAFLNLVNDLKLNAIAVNCFPFPYIKAKTCLALSNLNDIGIPASCEADVNSAILMYILQSITGSPGMNSDLIMEDQGENSILFSHCGCGPFSCSTDNKDISLNTHYEVKTGLGVYYPVKKGGKETTTVNMVGREGTYRLCALSGISLPTKELIYWGNPITVRYKTNITDLINILGNEGFGHHWIVSSGSHEEILKDFCRLVKIKDIYLD